MDKEENFSTSLWNHYVKNREVIKIVLTIN